MRDPFDDSPKEACGVFGVCSIDDPVAHLTYLGLYALQHRGQESAGMAVSDGEQLTVFRNMGLVSTVFDDRTLAPLVGHLAIGHTRYSTTGSSTWGNAQPTYRSIGDHQFALGHNGNLTNTAKLAAEHGMLPGTVASDTDLVAELLSEELAHAPTDQPPAEAAEAALVAVLPRLEGAFTFVVTDTQRVYGMRDPNGLRPLCLGRKGDAWVLASESPALDIVGAQMVREVEPGELVILEPGREPRSQWPFPEERIDPRLCLFEFVYFARPDARLYDQSVHHSRVRQGEALAAQAPVEADMVMGVPESGVPGAEGYARASGIPFGQGLVKNRYIGRTFIAPSQEMRALGVRMKFNPLRENIAGRRIVVVDDSVVRGTTQHQLVGMLREAGALEVHLRVTSPPVQWPCFFGMDFGDSKQLLAARLDVAGIQEYLGVDSLAYIEIDRLLDATGVRDRGFCTACFTGTYPIDVPVEVRKDTLEAGAMTRIENGSGAAAGSVLDQPSLLPADDASALADDPAPPPDPSED